MFCKITSNMSLKWSFYIENAVISLRVLIKIVNDISYKITSNIFLKITIYKLLSLKLTV
jgi:hypothetical protein